MKEYVEKRPDLPYAIYNLSQQSWWMVDGQWIFDGIRKYKRKGYDREAPRYCRIFRNFEDAKFKLTELCTRGFIHPMDDLELFHRFDNKVVKTFCLHDYGIEQDPLPGD